MKTPFHARTLLPAARSPLFGLLTAVTLALAAPSQAADKGDAGALLSAGKDKATHAVQDKAGHTVQDKAASLKSASSGRMDSPKDKASGKLREGSSRPARDAKSGAMDKAHGKLHDKAPAATTTGARLDLNRATEAELTALPGIGAARAQAIIKGRPYTGKDDLKRRRIIPANVYEDIRDRVIAHQR